MTKRRPVREGEPESDQARDRERESPVPTAALIVLAFGMLILAAGVIIIGAVRGDLNYTGVAMCLITASGGAAGSAILRVAKKDE
jgi:hypothetical protein